MSYFISDWRQISVHECEWLYWIPYNALISVIEYNVTIQYHIVRFSFRQYVCERANRSREIATWVDV